MKHVDFSITIYYVCREYVNLFNNVDLTFNI